jgi:hypothetical protein
MRQRKIALFVLRSTLDIGNLVIQGLLLGLSFGTLASDGVFLLAQGLYFDPGLLVVRGDEVCHNCGWTCGSAV